MSDSQPAVDFGALTARQQATWATGDFHHIGRQVQSVSEDLCTALNPRPGQRVLDVACGSGNGAMAAARRYCATTGLDFVPALIERGKVRAAAEGLTIDFRVGDAQALPFADGHFDVIMSVFGVMFAPDQEKAASELLRVCRPGGRIGIAAWTPEGFGGQFFRAHAKYLPPPPQGTTPAVRWGTDAGIRELLGRGAKSVRAELRTCVQHYQSIDHMLSLFREYFGPTRRAYETAGPAQAAHLTADLRAVLEPLNRATDGTVEIVGEYLAAVVVKA